MRLEAPQEPEQVVPPNYGDFHVLLNQFVVLFNPFQKCLSFHRAIIIDVILSLNCFDLMVLLKILAHAAGGHHLSKNSQRVEIESVPALRVLADDASSDRA